MKLKPLNRKEASKILETISDEYGCDAKELLIDDYTFFMSDKNKIYLMSNEIKEVDLTGVNINSFGLYFCEMSYDRPRLSMEGSLIIGKVATKNLLELDDPTAKDWLMGKDIDSSQEFEGFVIIKNGPDFIGCGKYKEGRILNYVPKPRRVNE